MDLPIVFLLSPKQRLLVHPRPLVWFDEEKEEGGEKKEKKEEDVVVREEAEEKEEADVVVREEAEEKKEGEKEEAGESELSSSTSVDEEAPLPILVTRRKQNVPPPLLPQPASKKKHAPQTRPAAAAASHHHADDTAFVESRTGSGVGGILAYIRRSAEDRSGRPLRAQVESISSYVVECLVPSLTGKEANVYAAASALSEKKEFVREYFTDNGVSGTTEPSKRDGMRRMLQLMNIIIKEEKTPVHIVAYDATRLARSISIGSTLKSSFEAAGVTLHLSQTRMKIEGASADLVFGLNLQIASSERTSTINRIRNSFAHNPDWDPRKSFGWRFDGAGTTPVPLEDEQAILREMQDAYEVKGESAYDIASALQAKYGGRRWRRGHDGDAADVDDGDAADADDGDVGAAERHHRSVEGGSDLAKWTSSQIIFLAKKHGWKWGRKGGKTMDDLDQEAFVAAHERGERMSEFLRSRRGTLYDGIKLTKGMVRHIFPNESMPPYRAEAFRLVSVWLKQEKHSIDDMAAMLNDSKDAQRPDGKQWPRQTTWRIVREAQHAQLLEKKHASAAANTRK
jgi:DNA invertase Pin-like site-specific DNA recombinase